MDKVGKFIFFLLRNAFLVGGGYTVVDFWFKLEGTIPKIIHSDPVFAAIVYISFTIVNWLMWDIKRDAEERKFKERAAPTPRRPIVYQKQIKKK